METQMAILVGGLLAAATYLLLSRNLLRLIFGFMLIGAAANLLIFTAGRLTRSTPPLVADGADALAAGAANPLSQALILTAIVISFGLTSFTLVLVYRTYKATGSMDVDLLAVEEGEGEEIDTESSFAALDPTGGAGASDENVETVPRPALRTDT